MEDKELNMEDMCMEEKCMNKHTSIFTDVKVGGITLIDVKLCDEHARKFSKWYEKEFEKN